MLPSTERGIYKVVVVLGLVFAIIPLITAKQIIYYPILEQPLFPFGNLLAAVAIFCFVSTGHVFINPLFRPVYERQRLLQRFSRGLLVLAALWLPLGYILAGDFAANFGPRESFQGSNFAGVIYRNYTIGLLIIAPLLWIVATIVKRLERRISMPDVVTILRDFIASGDKFSFATGYYWAGEKTTNILIEYKGHEIMFFIDAGEVDYIDWIKTADGRAGDYDYWDSDEAYDCQGPLDVMTRADHQDIEQRFEDLDKQLSTIGD